MTHGVVDDAEVRTPTVISMLYEAVIRSVLISLPDLEVFWNRIE